MSEKRKPTRKCSPKERERFRRWRRNEGRKVWVFAPHTLVRAAIERGRLSEASANDPDKVSAFLEAVGRDWPQLQDYFDAHHLK